MTVCVDGRRITTPPKAVLREEPPEGRESSEHPHRQVHRQAVVCDGRRSSALRHRRRACDSGGARLLGLVLRDPVEDVRDELVKFGLGVARVDDNPDALMPARDDRVRNGARGVSEGAKVVGEGDGRAGE